MAELEARPIHFISHQWLSTETADPTCAHLRTMQDVFRRVMGGENVFRSEDQWQTFAKGYSTTNKLYNKHNGFPNSEDLSTENFREAVSNGLVWLDFISVPQTAGCESPAATQHAATSARSMNPAATSPWFVASAAGPRPGPWRAAALSGSRRMRAWSEGRTSKRRTTRCARSGCGTTTTEGSS